MFKKMSFVTELLIRGPFQNPTNFNKLGMATSIRNSLGNLLLRGIDKYVTELLGI